jgi:DHA1 family bicyclomycin/chloramphenicol resistance-like MFS transporter
VTIVESDNSAAATITGSARLKLVLVLGALIALGPLTIDLYLPALPSIASELGTTSSAAQLTLTGTLLGLGLGQLLVGPLSDTVGRRVPLVAGTGVHVLASLVCLVAPNIEILTAGRILQGLGASAGAVLTLAVIRDLFVGKAAARLLSRLILVLSVSPILAPSLGGLLLRWTEWRGTFAVLAALGLAVTVLAAWGLVESLPPGRRRPLALRATLGTYGRLLSDRTFVGLVLVAGLTMAGLFAFVAGSSFVFQQQFGVSRQAFGLLFSAGAIWLIGATQLNPKLLDRYEPHQILLAGSLWASVAGVVLVVLATTGVGGLWGVALPLWAVLFGVGFVLPNAPVLALAPYGDSAGTAASLLGGVQFGVGAAVSPLVGLLGNNAAAMAAVIAGGLVLATAVLVVVVRPWRITAPTS